MVNPARGMNADRCRAGGKFPRTERALHVINLADGKILLSTPFLFSHFHLWGDRVVGVTDLQHRPRKANPEVWQLDTADPKDFRKLGGGWHVNGPTPVHIATSGYELPLHDAFAGGLLFARTVEPAAGNRRLVAKAGGQGMARAD